MPTPRQVDRRYRARKARTTGFRQPSSAPSGKALSIPRSPRLVVRGRAAKRVSDAVDDAGPRVEGPEVRREARTGRCEGDGDRRTTGNVVRGVIDRSRNVGRSGFTQSGVPAETLPRESPNHRYLRERYHHKRPRQVEVGEERPVRWEPSLRDRGACGGPTGDVHGELRTRSAWTSSQRLMSLRNEWTARREMRQRRPKSRP